MNRVAPGAVQCRLAGEVACRAMQEDAGSHSAEVPDRRTEPLPHEGAVPGKAKAGPHTGPAGDRASGAPPKWGALFSAHIHRSIVYSAKCFSTAV